MNKKDLANTYQYNIGELPDHICRHWVDEDLHVVHRGDTGRWVLRVVMVAQREVLVSSRKPSNVFVCVRDNRMKKT